MEQDSLVAEAKELMEKLDKVELETFLIYMTAVSNGEPIPEATRKATDFLRTQTDNPRYNSLASVLTDHAEQWEKEHSSGT